MEMRNIYLFIGIPSVFIIFLYILFSFNNWDMDRFYWIMGLSIIISLIVAVVLLYKKAENNKEISEKKLMDEPAFIDEVKKIEYFRGKNINPDYATQEESLRGEGGKNTHLYYAILESLNDNLQYYIIIDRGDPTRKRKGLYKGQEHLNKEIQKLNANPEKPSTEVRTTLFPDGMRQTEVRNVGDKQIEEKKGDELA